MKRFGTNSTWAARPIPFDMRFAALLEWARLRPALRAALGLAILDEADSVLIDEGSTPCVISGQGMSVGIFRICWAPWPLLKPW